MLGFSGKQHGHGEVNITGSEGVSKSGAPTLRTIGSNLCNLKIIELSPRLKKSQLGRDPHHR